MKGSGVASGGDIAERTDAVDRAGITAFRASMSTQPARQLILGVRPWRSNHVNASPVRSVMARMPKDVRKCGRFTVQLGPDVEGRKSAPWHDRVVRKLMADATDCRVFGVGKASPLTNVLKRIAAFRDRTWQLDLSTQVIRG